MVAVAFEVEGVAAFEVVVAIAEYVEVRDKVAA